MHARGVFRAGHFLSFVCCRRMGCCVSYVFLVQGMGCEEVPGSCHRQGRSLLAHISLPAHAHAHARAAMNDPLSWTDTNTCAGVYHGSTASCGLFFHQNWFVSGYSPQGPTCLPTWAFNHGYGVLVCLPDNRPGPRRGLGNPCMRMGTHACAWRQMLMHAHGDRC
jgi:hypothetical protein